MEDPCIRVLEPSFRITEVFLWEDARVITPGNRSLSLSSATSFSFPNSCVTADEETSTNHTVTEYISVEETESADQMDALGLPLSFGTSKVLNNVPSRSKRKGTKQKHASYGKEMNNTVAEVTVFNQLENPASSRFLHDSPNMCSCLYAMKGQTDACYHYVKEQFRCDWNSEQSTSIVDLGSRNDTIEKPTLAEFTELSDINYENLIKTEFSPDATSIEWNAEMLGSLNLHGSNCSEEVFEDACSQTQFLLDGDLLNNHVVEKCSDNSSTSHCCIHPKVDEDDSKTLQKCFDSAEFSLFHPFDDHHDNFISECGDWMVFWDPFYHSYYFFNTKSQESTWYPPPDLENYAFSCSNLISIKEAHVVAEEKNANSDHSCASTADITDLLTESRGGFHFTSKQAVELSAKTDSAIDFVSHSSITGNGSSNVQWSLHPSHVSNEENDCEDFQKEERQQGILSYNLMSEDGDALNLSTYSSSSCDILDSCENVAINKKRRVRRSHSNFLIENVDWFGQCISNKILKYWCQRYTLFSKFDKGIKMDEESWFSVTPELLAKHHAFRCGVGTIIDCFNGVGGNSIHFAGRSNHVVAIDIDPLKISYARHNAVIYGVGERIDFIQGDFFILAPTLKGDVVFLSPPWGGPDYAKAQIYDIRSLKPHDGYHLFKIASKIAAKVVMFLPRNVNLDQLADISLSVDPPWNLEVEKNYLNGKLKAVTAYFNKAPE